MGCPIQAFQSTLSWGERLLIPCLDRQHQQISIHALLGRATLTMYFMNSEMLFQSTLSWGERPIGQSTGQWRGAFQSTLSWGERREIRGQDIQPRYFNPRSPGESDGVLVAIGNEVVISIHALLGRATFWPVPQCPHTPDFNPRSPGESDYYEENTNDGYTDFNPRSPGESD